jgi:hypothetical protein
VRSGEQVELVGHTSIRRIEAYIYFGLWYRIKKHPYNEVRMPGLKYRYG